MHSLGNGPVGLLHDLEAKIVKTPGARNVFGVSKCFLRDFGALPNTWQAQKRWQAWWVWKGSELMLFAWQAQSFVLCDVGVWSLGRWIRGRVANFMLQKCYFAGIISRGSYRSSYASAQLIRGRRNTFEASASKSLKRVVILRPSVWSTCHFWRKSPRNASFLIFKAHFWRKSRKKASFLSFKASFLKEVSQKSFVFQLQDWILKEVSQKSFIFQLQSLNFEGSLAEKEISGSLEPQTSGQPGPRSFESHISWQPNRLKLKAFDIQSTWISNHMTTKSIESQSRWQPNHWNRKPTDNHTHLNLKSIDNQNHLNPKSVDNQSTWTSSQLTT